MPIEKSLPEYYKSFSKELDVVKSRVRNIIGDAHWASDGQHKEVILQEVLRRFIPKKYEIASGFIVADDGVTCSKQLDIIIYDQASPIVFGHSNFVIIPQKYVKSVIEVKTSISGSKFIDALENLYSVQRFMRVSSDSAYFGIFSYGYQSFSSQGPNEVARRLMNRMTNFYLEKREDLRSNDLDFLRCCTLTSLCLNGNIYGLHWNGERERGPEFGFYNTKEQTFNFFLSNLLNTLDNETINGSKPLWYPTSKESSLLLKERLI